MKKGFTLIELLAVIIVLAVIALITTPIVLNVVDNAKESSRISSVNNLIDATRLYMTEALLDDSIDLSGNLLDIINTRVKGTKPSEGEIKINGNDIGIAVKIDGTCYSKYYTSDEIRKTTDEDCFIALEASDYVMTALDAVINYEECVANLNSILETSYSNEELGKICKNELEIEGMKLKEAIMYSYRQDDEMLNDLLEANIAKLDYVEEQGYEKCFTYTGSEGISDFEVDYDACMQVIQDEEYCNKESIIEEFSDQISGLVLMGVVKNVQVKGDLVITDYWCGDIVNSSLTSVLPVVTDVVMPTTINGMKVVEIAGVENKTATSFILRGLTSVDFTNARYLEKIGDMAFVQNFIGASYGIEGEIDLSNSTNLKEIGMMAFATNKITSLKLPDKIISIGEGAFNGNFLPYDQAFFYKVIDNNGVLEIDDSVLVSYGGYGDVVFPSNIKEIATSFDGMDTNLGRVGGLLDLSQTKITSIDDEVFRMTDITELKLPSSLETIGGNTFANNLISGELDLSNLTNLTTIGYEAFWANQITSVKLPNSLTEIEYEAFGANSNLTLIEIDNTKDAIEGAPWGAENAEIKWLRDSE